MTVEDIARICHEADRAYLSAVDNPEEVKPWDEASEQIKERAFRGVRFLVAHPSFSAKDLHDSWRLNLTTKGWKTGPVLCEETKTHPMLVDYDRLSYDQQIRDRILVSLVKTLVSV